MINKWIILISIFLASCRIQQESFSLIGQPYPDDIPVVFAPEVVSMKDRLEHGISFTPDMEELAFGVLDRDSYQGSIYYAQRNSKKWTEPKIFEPLKDENVHLPYFSPNGQYFLYAKDSTADFSMNTDIWRLEKIKGLWGNPISLGAPINSASREANACMTYDNTIYFSSNRKDDDSENRYDADLFRAKQVNGQYEKANKVEELSSIFDEESIFVSPQEDYILFCRYTDDKGCADLYISYVDAKQKWSEPQKLDSTINTKDWERRPFVSANKKFLFFTRLQIHDDEIIESDIYWVNTSKVFKPYVYNPIPDLTMQSGKPFVLEIPQDYFKHIHDDLTYTINHNAGSWLKFDHKKGILLADTTHSGQFEITFIARDKHLNESHHIFKLKIL